MAFGRGDKLLRILLAPALLALAVSLSAGQARALDWPSEQQLGSTNRYERIDAWDQVEHLFSVEKLSPAAFARYASALAAADCELAVEVLWQAFVELEPGLAQRARDAAVANGWLRSVVPFRFPQHDFCDARRGFHETTTRLDDAGKRLAPETATLGRAGRRNTDVLPSDQAYLIETLQVLFNVAHFDNPDAIRFILGKDRIGRHVKLTDEQRLSLLVRLARLGEAGPDERARAMKLAQHVPLSTVAAARRYAAREVSPEFERWQAYQARLGALGTTAEPPGSP